MKKISIFVCILLVGVMLLTSCDSLSGLFARDPETAEELWERIDRSMEEQGAYALSLDMNMTMVMEGYEIKTTASGSIIEDTGEDYYYYSETNMKMECKELELKQSQKQISAYWEGKAFEILDTDSFERKVYSEMTPEEYAAYQSIGKDEGEDDGEDDELDLTDCTKSDFVKNEDESWTLTYSGYTKKAMQQVTEEFGAGDQDLLGAEILDMKLTVNADADFCVTELSIVFEFDVEQGAQPAPALEICMKVVELGEVTRETDKLDVSKCTKIDDLALPAQIEQMIEDRYEAEEGSFHFETSQTVKVMGQTDSYSESDDVTYGVTDGKFHYELSTKMDGAATTITYKDGKQTVVYAGETYTETQSEEDAKAFIRDMINDTSVGYSADCVTEVKSLGDGVYEIKQGIADPTAFEQTLEAMGAEYKSAKQTVRVTVKDGSLISIENVMDIKGSLRSGNSTFEIGLYITMKTDFS